LEGNVDIHSACDYIIASVWKRRGTLNVLKLQKLLYYAQAWYLAFFGEPLFPGKFQAWKRGPINREIYDRFVVSRSLDSEVSDADVSKEFNVTRVSEENGRHLDQVLKAYAKYGETELQDLVRHEAPWREALGRGDERSEREIDESNIRRYYTVVCLMALQEMQPCGPAAIQSSHLPIGPDQFARCIWPANDNNMEQMAQNPHL
jgi:uncharacterized phage-associated protein